MKYLKKILQPYYVGIHQGKEFLGIFTFHIQQLFAYTRFKSRKATKEINRRKEVMNDKFSDKVKFRPFPIFGQSTAYTKTTTI